MEISHPLVTVELIPTNEAWITHERMIGQFAHEDPYGSTRAWTQACTPPTREHGRSSYEPSGPPCSRAE